MTSSNSSDWIYLRRLLMTVAVAGFAYIAWKIASIFVLLFAAVLLAILLDGLAKLITAYTFIARRWALTAVALGLALLLGTVLFIFGTQLASQIAEVFSRAPQALDAAGKQFGISDASERIANALSSNSGGQFLSQAANIGYSLVGGLADLVLVVVTGVYLAADPRLYRDGVTKLLPPNQHERVLAAMGATAAALRLWFVGQLVSMILVAALSGIGFWLIGLPSPAGLGAIAGITNFVPLIGPVLGAIPAVLFAFTEGTSTILWTLVLIFGIQQLEGYVIMPLVQRRAVDVPPAVVLFAIAGFGVLFGWLGIIFAVPLAVAVMVLVQKLWIRQALGENTPVAGEEKPSTENS